MQNEQNQKEKHSTVNRATKQKKSGFSDRFNRSFRRCRGLTESCKNRVQSHFKDRMDDIKTLLNAEDYETEELGSLYDYGLCIDFVGAGTFKEQREPYYRYQLSWGGPADEFRVFLDGSVEYWFLDWFDGAKVLLGNGDAEIIKEIVSWKYPRLDRYPEDYV
jgi:hypothetical protein